MWRDDEADYHEYDWMNATITAHGNTLCYFDDHINHAQRVIEAHARGFRTLLFDDDFPAYHLHATGHPPLPTIAMIYDETLGEAEDIKGLAVYLASDASCYMTGQALTVCGGSNMWT